MVTLEVAQTHLAAWLDAELKLAQAQSYSFSTPSGNRMVQRADLPEVRRQVAYWLGMIQAIQAAAAGRKFSLADFRDPEL